MLIGSCLTYNYSNLYAIFGFTYHSILYSGAYMLGCIISESYYSKWNEKNAIFFLWISFAISNSLIYLITIKPNTLFKVLSSLGFALSSGSQAILMIVEIGYVTDYMRRYPDSFALSTLLSFTQVCFILLIPLSFISQFTSLMLSYVITAICIKITWKFTGTSPDYTDRTCTKDIILPFSLFVLEFYVFGVWDM